MAASTEASDPRTLKSWEDAFQYSTPTVRAMEKKLRSHAVENHDKLRSLVGASYRDLLGTARMIIEVNEQMQDVESLMRGAAKKTDSRRLDKLSQNCAIYSDQVSGYNQSRYELASQASTLAAAVDCVMSHLKTRHYGVLSAKLLILARLLHNSIARLQQSAEGSRVVPLKQLSLSIGSLRGRLLRNVDRQLCRIDLDVTLLVEYLTVFTVLTSSSPSDALKHFHYLRSQAIRRAHSPNDQTLRSKILRRLHLFNATTSQSSSIFPHLISAALRRLGEKVLLDDDAVLALEELKLDVHKRWFGTDILSYTPWTRPDELSKSATVGELNSWSSTTFDLLVSAVRQDIAEEVDIDKLVHTRKEVLQAWLPSRGSSRALGSRKSLLRLAAPFMHRIEYLIDGAVSRLCTDTMQSIRTMRQAPDTWEKGTNSDRVWSRTVRAAEMSEGAIAFRKAIIDSYTGRSIAVSNVLRVLDARIHSIASARKSVKAMKELHWEDDYEDDVEDDNDGMLIFPTLGREQPEELNNVLGTKILESIQKLNQDLEVEINTNKGTDYPYNTFLTRLLREIRTRLATILEQIEPPTAKSLSFETQTAALHASIVRVVTQDTEKDHRRPMQTFARQALRIQDLWDGNPLLPLQASPATFRYLRDVIKRMESLGADLWTQDLVIRLKIGLREHVDAAIQEVMVMLSARQAIKRQSDLQDEHTVSNGATHMASDETTDLPQPTPNTTDIAESDQEDIRKLKEHVTQDETQVASNANGNHDELGTPEAIDLTPNMPSINKDPHADLEGIASQPVSDLELQAKYTQLLFDVLYLQRAFSVNKSPQSQRHKAVTNDLAKQADKHLNDDFVDKLRAKARLGEDGRDLMEMAKLKQNAETYWKRTYLLFGLLYG